MGGVSHCPGTFITDLGDTEKLPGPGGITGQMANSRIPGGGTRWDVKSGGRVGNSP